MQVLLFLSATASCSRLSPSGLFLLLDKSKPRQYDYAKREGAMTNVVTFQTRDLPLAAFLLYNKLELLGSATTSKPGSNMIVFLDRPDREDLSKAFELGAEVDAKQYAKCIHQVGKAVRKPVEV